MPDQEVIITADVPGHGTFSCPAIYFDLMMLRYLPASPRKLIEELRGREGINDYSDVKDVSVLLLILAEYDGFGV